MSIAERVEKWLEPGEPVVAAAAESFLTNVQQKQSQTSTRVSANRRRVTTRSWKEFASEGIPVVLTDRRMVRLGDAAPAGRKVGDAVWRLYKDLDHQVPYSELRSFTVKPTKEGLAVRLVPLVGRETKITVTAGEEPERIEALKRLARQFEEGAFAQDDGRRRVLAKRGAEVVQLRDLLSDAIVAGRMSLLSPLGIVAGVVMAPFVLAFSVFILNITMYEVDRWWTDGRSTDWPLVLFLWAVIAVMGLVTVGSVGVGGFTTLRTLRAQRREKQLVGRLRALQDTSTVGESAGVSG